MAYNKNYRSKEKNYNVKTVYDIEASSDEDSSFKIIDYSERSYAVCFERGSASKDDYKEVKSMDCIVNSRLKDENDEIFTGFIFRKDDKESAQFFADKLEIPISQFNKEMNIPERASPKTGSTKKILKKEPELIPGIPSSKSEEEPTKLKPSLEEAMMVVLEAMREGKIDSSFMFRRTLTNTNGVKCTACIAPKDDALKLLPSDTKGVVIDSLTFAIATQRLQEQ